MFLVFVMMVAVVGIVAAAPNFRSADAELHEVPANVASSVDHNRARRAYVYLRKTAHSPWENHKSIAVSYVGGGDSNAKNIMEMFPNGFDGHSVMRTVATNPEDEIRYVPNAFLITRLHPNGDGSGKSPLLTAVKTGCMEQDYYSLAYECAHETPDGRIPLRTSYFSNSNCTGQPYYVYEDHYSNKVSVNQAYQRNFQPFIQKLQCGTPSVEKIMNQPGMLSVHYEGNAHNGSIASYSVEKFGACELVLGDDGRSFSFVRLDTCSRSAGTLSLSVFCDPGCTRPLYHGVVAANETTTCVPPL